MIGIFDSGVGGLTVVKEIFKYLPDYQIIYFGDTARLPYGTKGAGFVKKYSVKITDWLLKKKVKLVLVACHTSSAWASDFLKKEFKKTPIFDVITPAVKEVLSIAGDKKIGIIGTPGTIKSSSWKKKLLESNPGLKIYLKSCPLFVPLAEEGWVDEKATREIAKEYLKEFSARGGSASVGKKKIDILILACTHYPLLKKVIGEIIGPGVKIINPAESLARELKVFLKNNPQIASQIKKGKNHQFYFSDEPYNLKKISKLCFRKEIRIKVMDPF